MSYYYSIVNIESSFLVREENLLTHEISEEWLKNLIFFKKSKETYYMNTETGRGVANNRMIKWLEKNHSELLL